MADMVTASRPTTLTPVARLRRKPGVQLALLALIAAVDNVDDLILFAALPLIAQAFRLSDTMLGLLPLIETIAYALAAMFVAGLADQYLRKPIICAGVLGWAVACATCGLAGVFLLFAFSRFIIGVAQTAFDGPASSTVTDMYAPDKRGWALGTLNAGDIAGILIGFGLEGVFISLFGWRQVFLAAAVLAAVVFGVAAWLLGEPTRGATDAEPQAYPVLPLKAAISASFLVLQQNWKAIWFGRGAQLAAIIGRVGEISGFYGIAFFFPLMLTRYYQLDIALASALLGGIVLLALVGSLVGGVIDGKLHQHFGPASRYLLAGGSLIGMGSAYVLGLVVGGLPAILLGGAVMGLCTGAANPPLGALVGDIHPASWRASAFAAQFIPAFLFGGVASAAIGALSDVLHSLRWASALFVLLIIIVGGLVCLASRTVRQRAAA